MAGKRILFADADGKALEEFRGVLDPQWQVTGVTNGRDALAAVANGPCEIVVACIDLPEVDGAEVLNQIRIAHPETIRFIMGNGDLKERVIDHMLGGNQFLAKPFDKATVNNAIERSLSAANHIVNTSMRELIGRIRTFPTMPSLYLEVISALNNPDTTTEDVGAIVARDMGMTTKMLQVLNSAYFALPRAITDPAEAVGILGFDMVKSLIMSVKLMSQYDKIKPVYFSVDSIWRHSTNVAWIAKQFALLESGDPELAASAYTAGLMHDIGKVILAANFDHQYADAHALARKRSQPLWEVEKEVFGASHAEIGAYLFGLWGMPPAVVEASAFHHNPSKCVNTLFSPLTAVHVANVLEYEGRPASPGDVLPVFDLGYLGELGLINRLDMWRDAVCNTSRTPAVVRPQAPTPPLPEPVAPVILEKPKAAPLPVRDWSWANVLYGTLGMAAVFCLLCWLNFKHLDATTKYAVLEPVAQPEVSTAPPVAAAPAVVAVVQPVVPVVPPVTTPSPQPTAAELAWNDVKVQGVFFSANGPSAIINGRLRHLNDTVDNFRVLAISAKSITLESQSMRKTIALR